MKWIIFSAGAEYLLKGALILGEKLVPIPEPRRGKLVIPAANEVEAWLAVALTSAAPREKVSTYLTLRQCLSRLAALCDEKLATAARERLRLQVAYAILAESIRNRDAHAYVPKVRADHHHLVLLFCPAFNTLVGWTDSAVLAEASSKVAR